MSQELSPTMIQTIRKIGNKRLKRELFHETVLRSLKRRGLVTLHSRVTLTSKGKRVLAEIQNPPAPGQIEELFNHDDASFQEAFYKLFPDK